MFADNTLRVLASAAAAVVVVLGVGMSLQPSGSVTSTALTSPVVDSRSVVPLDDLRAADAFIAAPFTASFEMRRSASWFDPDQGDMVMSCVLTSANGELGLSVVNNYERAPRYQAPRTPGYERIDFDKLANLIVWRSLESFALSSADLNRVWDLQQMSRVSPAGGVINSYVLPQVYDHALGNPDGVYQADQFWLALGRGFSRHVREIRAQQSTPDGLTETRAGGGFGSGLSGEWKITSDPARGGLVRSAVLIEDAGYIPSITVRTFGSIEVAPGVILPTSGEIVFDHHDTWEDKIEVTLIGFSSTPNLDHLQQLRAKLTAPLPPGVEYIDYRGSEPQRSHTE